MYIIYDSCFWEIPFKIIRKHWSDWIKATSLSSCKGLWFSDLQPTLLNGGKEAFSRKLHWSRSFNIYNLNSTHYCGLFENQPVSNFTGLDPVVTWVFQH